MFCICIHNELLERIKTLNYKPVGLGPNSFAKEWIRDNSGKNISDKNKFYGEHSFHYWLWKNKLENIEDGKWIGFCAYRRFWQNKKDKIDNIVNFNNDVLNHVPKEWDDYDVILGDKISMAEVSWTKVIKYGKIAFLKNSGSIFKKGRNIKFHFDMFHGNGMLDKAINLLNDNDREDFRSFVIKNTSYNQGNMFICKSKKIMEKYYETIFEWLEKCEKVFGFNLEGYGNLRIYAFLAERFLPFWFNKYSKILEWPILFYDLKNENN